MSDIDGPEIESRLRDIPLVSVPQAFRARALDAARRHRIAKSWTSPGQRRWLAACAAVLVVAFAADSLVSNIQGARLVALSGATRPQARLADDQNGLLAEVLGNGAIPRLEAAALGSPEPPGAGGKRRPALRIRLRSSLSEDPEIEVLTEDSHDSPKNLH